MYLQPDEPFPSLYELAKRACIRHADRIDDVGDLPFWLVKPILAKMASPANLRTLEENCPQIAEEDSEIWREFIRRDFGEAALDDCEPASPKSWGHIYRKLKRAQERKDKQQISALKAQIQEANEKREKRRVAVVPFNMRDRAEMRKLDGSIGTGMRTYSMSGRSSSSGRVGKPGPFKNRTLNKVLTKGMGHR
ncbi:Elongin-A [Drechslerella dactyloides]|uniref:Elongin-A n=1 Tax=Drechslerella dactyloides TaxID=74499 RepID=A0AAD6J2V0_DREDA|nr:Elongin-A [Drechslerella dactyloides]